MSEPVQTLSDAIGAALHRDLSPIVYKDRNNIDRTRRPDRMDIEVIMFSQTWSSTALGYGGVGGQAFTSAYTVIVIRYDEYCVYFGGSRLAYKIKSNKLTTKGRLSFMKDIANRNLPEIYDVAKRYERKHDESDLKNSEESDSETN